MKPGRRQVLAGLAASGGLAGRAAAAPDARLIPGPWQLSGSGDGPDHSDWGQILARRRSLGADGIARVDYAGLRDDIPALDAYLDALQATDPTGLARPVQMAFWINLYNALTVRVVAAAWPVGSIREVMGGLFNLGPWDEKLVRVAGHDLSLDDVEHGILRPVFAEPRIHYAVNCAALGCPNLAAEPWEASRLEEMLQAGARDYVNHPRGARIADGRLVVSSIYRWFAEDFGGSDIAVIRHLAAHAGRGLAAGLAGRRRIDDDAYDWSVNGL